MKMSIKVNRFNLCILVIICSCLMIPITSGIAITPVCTKPGEQQSPAVSGETIVWMDWSSDYDIYRWDPTDGIQAVCTYPGDQMYPAISGATIVWMDNRDYGVNGWDIYKWDPTDGIQAVCTYPGDQMYPAISGATIVWMDNRDYGVNGWDIYKWDPADGIQAVCTYPGDQMYPAISGVTIVWQDDNNEYGEYDIYTWDPADGIQAVCTYPGDQMEPAISGDTIVWTDLSGDISMWDPVKGIQSITGHGFPSISGDTIVWAEQRDFSSYSDIYLWDPVKGEKPVCTAPGDQQHPSISGDIIVWEDNRNYGSGGWDIYMADLSKTPQRSLEGLIMNVESLELPSDIETGLTDKLYAAIHSLDEGQDGAGINQITAFTNQVNAQAGKSLSQEEADDLIAVALDIVTAIGIPEN
jgi:beta propeller repeat protein